VVLLAYKASLEHLERLGNRVSEYDPVVQMRLLPVKDASAHDYLRALRAHTALCVRAQQALRDVEAQQALRDVEALLAPTTMIPSLPVAEVDASLDAYGLWNPRFSVTRASATCSASVA
jgi:Asp-tRNA(Asn)/Glu-tRNA(Gln) amidotransferase A subunit family amidase